MPVAIVGELEGSCTRVEAAGLKIANGNSILRR